MVKSYGILLRTKEDNERIAKSLRKAGWTCHRIEYEGKHIKELD